MISIFKKWIKGASLVTDAGWGDSGKGKVVSSLDPQICAKIIGGHNAGHTIVTDKGEFGLGLVPSTITNPKVLNIIGPEVVINPFFLANEIKTLRKRRVRVDKNNFAFDFRSHLILPWHEIRDALSEEARGKAAVGSLHLGVGWAYSDRINRRGLRFLDLTAKDWKKRVGREAKNQKSVIEEMRRDVKRKTGKKSKVDTTINLAKLLRALEKVRKMLIPLSKNTIEIIWQAIDKNKKILFEDSHGAMLEVSHGSWPFTTGVNTALGAIHRSFGGKAVKSLTKTITVVKAYQTRVGGGPMPTENKGKLGNFLQIQGGEVGTRSGRKRRCGPLDIPLIRYGLNVIGASSNDEIALTKLDVLTRLPEIKVCIAYKLGSKKYATSPATDAEFLLKVKPVYAILPGWSEDISEIKRFKDLPQNAQKYVKFVESKIGRKITLVGVGKHKNAKILP